MAENKILLEFVSRNFINKGAIGDNLFITASCVHSLKTLVKEWHSSSHSVLRSSKHLF